MKISTTQSFIAALRATGRTPKTLERYKHHLEHYVHFVAKHKRVTSLADVDRQVVRASKATINAYIASLVRDDFAISTVGRRMTAINGLYDHLRNAKVITKNPTIGITTPKLVVGQPNVLTDHDIITLLNNLYGSDFATVRDRLLVKLLAFCGLNLSEAMAITPEDVNTANCEITVVRDGRPVQVEMSRAVSTDMIKYLLLRDNRARSNDLLIGEKSGNGLSIRSIRASFARQAKQAGIECVELANALVATNIARRLRLGKNSAGVKEPLGIAGTQGATRYATTSV